MPVFFQLAVQNNMHVLYRLVLNKIVELLIGRDLTKVEENYAYSQTMIFQRLRITRSQNAQSDGYAKPSREEYAKQLLAEICKSRENTKITCDDLIQLLTLIDSDTTERNKIDRLTLRDICLNKYKGNALDLSKMKIVDQDVSSLIRVLNENETITQLNLHENYISDTGARAIAYSKYIQILDVSDNLITTHGAIALAENQHFIELNIAKNKLVGNRGMHHLTCSETLQRLKNK